MEYLGDMGTKRWEIGMGLRDMQAALRIAPPCLCIGAITNIKDNELWAMGTTQSRPWEGSHFTHISIMPGSLIMEGMGQAALAYLRLHERREKEIVLYAIDKASFYQPVKPKSTLEYHVRKTGTNKNKHMFSAEAAVSRKVVASALITLAIVEKLR